MDATTDELEVALAVRLMNGHAPTELRLSEAQAFVWVLDALATAAPPPPAPDFEAVREAAARGRAPPAPPCARCGAPRWFEFQILPQLLGAIEPEADGGGGGGSDGAAAANPLAPSAGSLDWGTACVYTCSASCAGADGGEYAEEYVWHQAL